MNAVIFERNSIREVWLRYPGGNRGGWIRPDDSFLTTREANLQGWKSVEIQENAVSRSGENDQG